MSRRKDRERPKMTREELAQQYKARAHAERSHGGAVKINWRLPTVGIKLSDGSDYFFQGEEATNLLDEIEGYCLDCNPGDILLAIAQGW